MTEKFLKSILAIFLIAMAFCGTCNAEKIVLSDIQIKSIGYASSQVWKWNVA